MRLTKPTVQLILSLSHYICMSHGKFIEDKLWQVHNIKGRGLVKTSVLLRPSAPVDHLDEGGDDGGVAHWCHLREHLWCSRVVLVCRQGLLGGSEEVLACLLYNLLLDEGVGESCNLQR